MTFPENWKDYHELERVILKNNRAEWILSFAAPGETISSIARAIGIERGGLHRMIVEYGIFEEIKSRCPTVESTQAVVKKGNFPKPKPKPLCIKDLTAPQQAKYNALRSELGKTHHEALSLMVAEVRANG